MKIPFFATFGQLSPHRDAFVIVLAEDEMQARVHCKHTLDQWAGLYDIASFGSKKQWVGEELPAPITHFPKGCLRVEYAMEPANEESEA